VSDWRTRLLTLRPINLASVEAFVGRPVTLEAAAWVAEESVSRAQRMAEARVATGKRVGALSRGRRGKQAYPRRPGADVGGRPVEWPLRLKPCIVRAGEWHAIAKTPARTNASSLQHDLAGGRYKRPMGEWEFASRTVDVEGERHYLVFARYVGETVNP
jgi:hypothetical protein